VTRINTHMTRVALAFTVTGLVACATVPAAALAGTPQWTVTSVSRPTNFVPGDEKGDNEYVVTITNTGDASSSGPVTITDEFPEGLSLAPSGAFGEDGLAIAESKPPRANFECVFGACTYTGVVVPDDTLIVTFPVNVAASPKDSCGPKVLPATAVSCVTNVVRVAGGGALDASASTQTLISATPAAFGMAPGGATTSFSSTQAGGHPDVTFTAAFNTVNLKGALAGDYKNVTYELPAGFALDLVDSQTCSLPDFGNGACPIASQVGIATVTTQGASNGPLLEPVYNLAPNPGSVAKIGFLGHQASVALLPNYSSATTFENTPQSLAQIDNVSLTLWGVPADPIHDPLRENPTQKKGNGIGGFGSPSDAAPTPFFTTPTSCSSEPLHGNFKVDSWESSNAPVEEAVPFGPFVGCDRLTMEPSLVAEATTRKAYAATGLDVTTGVHQTYGNAHGLVASTLKRAVVTLPEGMTVNPSAGAGLVGCTQSEYAEEAAQFVAGSGCPNESKLGDIQITTPVLKEQITGSVFLAQPEANPFHSLLALYIVARIPDRGIVVKAAGEVTPDPFTGRLVTTFDNLPPEPFSSFTLKFNQGATSPLVTPPGCGVYTVQAELTPWATPAEALPLLYAPPFPISEGFDGGPCPSGGVPPFHPQAIAGTQINSAGAYSPMYIRVIRGDGEQEITRFSSQLPAGLTANLSGVPFCPDANIQLAREKTGAQEEAKSSCPGSSEIGHTLVGAGVGSVLAWAPGKVYMAGPYNGAPFSIVAVTAAKVGPFDLGTVVVREALKIDPTTAIVTVDASASDPIPHIIKGIVVHVRDIRVYVDRTNFTLNPTSCARMTFSATITGSGANFASLADDVPVTVGDPFQAADCQALKFKPTFKAFTSGKTSRSRGASLSVKLTYPKAPQGTQANIRSVKVDLPKQLPSRLTTLQKACLDRTFNANPAACSQASRVGQASAIVPILPVPLTGPAYFVSHGGAKFPELIIVLQGYGVTIDLHGETFISKKGITSSTFHAIPDSPVTSFQLTLPQGANSALAANGNLCKSKLAMPTVFTGQNGLVIHQSTKITVTGCGKGKAKHARRRGKGVHQNKK
jgi:uncharacterized repeat protein (TIGR01451 family)